MRNIRTGVFSYSALSEFDGIFLFLRTHTNLEGDFLICSEDENPGFVTIQAKSEFWLVCSFWQAMTLERSWNRFEKWLRNNLHFELSVATPSGAIGDWETKCFLHWLSGQLPQLHPDFALQGHSGSQTAFPKQGGHDRLALWRDLVQAAIDFEGRTCSVICNVDESFPWIPVLAGKEELKESDRHFSVIRKKNRRPALKLNTPINY